MAALRSILEFLSLFFLHWILQMIINPKSTYLEVVHGCAQSCAEKWQNISRSLISRGFRFKWPHTGQFLVFCYGSSCIGSSSWLWTQCAPAWELSISVHRAVLKSDKIPLDLYYLEVLLQMATHRSILGLLSWFFLHWILLLGIVHGCAQSCAEKWQNTSRSLLSRGFCFKRPLTGQFFDFCHGSSCNGSS